MNLASISIVTAKLRVVAKRLDPPCVDCSLNREATSPHLVVV